MEIMMGVSRPHSSMTFNGYKPFEFRETVLEGMDTGYPTEDIKAYIYEPKKNGGSEKVIGEVMILGSYALHYKDEEVPDTDNIKARYAFVKQMYLQWCDLKSLKPNTNEGWFKSKKFQRYQEEIGFVDGIRNPTCNYALILDSPTLYNYPKSLNKFVTPEGKAFAYPPENMMRVSCKTE